MRRKLEARKILTDEHTSMKKDGHPKITFLMGEKNLKHVLFSQDLKDHIQ